MRNGEDVVPRVFGEPYERPDGTLVIPVVKVSGTREVAALGVFVIHDGTAKWEPAVDTNLRTLLAQLVWLVPATLVAVAMIRRPPWPDVRMALTKAKGRLPLLGDGPWRS